MNWQLKYRKSMSRIVLLFFFILLLPCCMSICNAQATTSKNICEYPGRDIAFAVALKRGMLGESSPKTSKRKFYIWYYLKSY